MRATCIRYIPSTTPVPAVMAKADDTVSFTRILQLAKKYQIPVIVDPTAAMVLHQLPLDEPIPERLYRLVASLIIGLSKFSGGHRRLL